MPRQHWREQKKKMVDMFGEEGAQMYSTLLTNSGFVYIPQTARAISNPDMTEEEISDILDELKGKKKEVKRFLKTIDRTKVKKEPRTHAENMHKQYVGSLEDLAEAYVDNVKILIEMAEDKLGIDDYKGDGL